MIAVWGSLPCSGPRPPRVRHKDQSNERIRNSTRSESGRILRSKSHVEIPGERRITTASPSTVSRCTTARQRASGKIAKQDAWGAEMVCLPVCVEEH